MPTSVTAYQLARDEGALNMSSVQAYYILRRNLKCALLLFGTTSVKLPQQTAHLLSLRDDRSRGLNEHEGRANSNAPKVMAVLSNFTLLHFTPKPLLTAKSIRFVYAPKNRST